MKDKKICWNCKYGDKEMLYCIGIGCGTSHGKWKPKENVEVVEDVEKSCETCGCPERACSTVTKKGFCRNHDYFYWEPLGSTEKIMRETADPSKIVKGSEQRKKLEENRPITLMENCGFVNGELVINSQGGKQSKINTAFSLVPHDSLLAVAKVMKIGSERYEKDNWRKLSTDEIYDHLMEHLVNWHMTGNMEDLEHGVTRAMMLYSVANDGQ